MAIELDSMTEYHVPVKQQMQDKETAPGGEKLPQPPSKYLKRKSSRVDSGSTRIKRPNLGGLSPSGTSNSTGGGGSCYSDSMSSSPPSSSYGSMSNRSPSYSSYSSPANFDSDADSATYSPDCSDAEEESEAVNGKPLKTKVSQDDNIELAGYYDEIIEDEDDSLARNGVDRDGPPGVDEEDSIFPLPDDNDDAEGDGEDREGDSLGPRSSSTTNTAEEENDEEVDSPELRAFNKSSIKKMLVLLRDMRLRIRRVPDLARAENLSILLRACKTIPEPTAYCQPVLSFLVQDTENFANLLQSNFIVDLYNLRHPPTTAVVDHLQCRLCGDMRRISQQVLENVSVIAESGYGRGELAHYLLTGESGKRKHVALVTALVVRDAKFLYSLLFEHGALKIVMDEILDESQETRSEEACLGITALAVNLNLYLEGEEINKKEAVENGDGEEDEGDEGGEDVKVGVVEKEERKEIKVADFAMKTESDSKITFLLSDGERIEFNEEVLVSYSDVFNSMFSRDFQESKFKEVLISDVSSGGLKYFLQLVQHFQANPAPRRFQHVPKTEKITVALEAYELSIKYMLNEIERTVLRHVKKLVDDESVQDMFEWAMRNKNADMLEMSIYYYLNSDLPGGRKLRMFRRANSSVYREEWQHWLVDTIRSKCSAALGLMAMTE